MRNFQLLSLFMASCLAVASARADGVKKAEKPGPHELVGFLLRQNRTAIEARLGKPFHQEEADGWMSYAYRLEKERDAYLVAFYGEKDRVLKMELTGDDYNGPTGFFGLRLGDSAEKVQAALGKPSTISHETDVNVDLWDYKDATYSVEMSADHKLYSIQIVDDNESLPAAYPGADAVNAFAKAFAAHDVDAVMAAVSGEIVCTDGKNYGIQMDNARNVLFHDNSAVSACLQKAVRAILATGPEMDGSDSLMRVWPEVGQTGAVVKMPASSSLTEVVFVVETGGWRVFEVTFRQKTGVGKPTQ